MPHAPPPDGITIGRGEGIVWNKLHAVLATDTLAIPALANTEGGPPRETWENVPSPASRDQPITAQLCSPRELTETPERQKSRHFPMSLNPPISASVTLAVEFLQNWWGMIAPLWKLFPRGHEIMAGYLTVPLSWTFSVETHVLKSCRTENRFTICGSQVSTLVFDHL